MPTVTLIMTRKPPEEFKYGHRSGRWSRLAVVQGPKVLAASFFGSTGGSTPAIGPALGSGAANAGLALARATFPGAVGLHGTVTIPFAGRLLGLVTEGGGVHRVTELDSMERFKADSGTGYYMQVKPRPDKPYPLTMYISPMVKELNQTGRCLRVHDHGYKQQGSGAAAGILVHEAPHVGWLIGCISPREKGYRKLGEDKEPSRSAMDAIFAAMGGFEPGKKAALIVLDW